MNSHASANGGSDEKSQQKLSGGMSLSQDPEGDPIGDHRDRGIKAQEDHLKSESLGIGSGVPGYNQGCLA